MSLENLVKPAGKTVCPADSLSGAFILGQDTRSSSLGLLTPCGYQVQRKPLGMTCGVSVLWDHSQHRGVLCCLACTALK